jgi:hypothetical protein
MRITPLATTPEYGPTATTVTTPYEPPLKERPVTIPTVEVTVAPAVEEEEDLDDFFASLE